MTSPSLDTINIAVWCHSFAVFTIIPMLAATFIPQMRSADRQTTNMGSTTWRLNAELVINCSLKRVDQGLDCCWKVDEEAASLFDPAEEPLGFLITTRQLYKPYQKVYKGFINPLRTPSPPLLCRHRTALVENKDIAVVSWLQTARKGDGGLS